MSDDETIVSGHTVRMPRQEPSGTRPLSRQPSPMIIGTALVAPLPMDAAADSSPLSTQTPSAEPVAATLVPVELQASPLLAPFANLRELRLADRGGPSRSSTPPPPQSNSASSSEAIRADATIISYEEEQQELERRAEYRIAHHKLSVLERLDRVRRGQHSRSTTHDSPSSPRAPDDDDVDTTDEPPLLVARRRSRGGDAMAHADAGRRRAAASDSGGATLCEIDAAAMIAAAPRCEEPRIRVGSFERESSQFESLQFEDEESKVHLELRADDSESSGFALVIVSFALTLAIGFILGSISTLITLTESWIYEGRKQLVERVMWPCGQACAESEARPTAAFFAYLGVNLGLVLAAALLTTFAPRAAMSGLPPLKAYLNGTRVNDLLSVRTLIAKVVGITLIVSTGLPLGREGPMVHTGAIVAATLSRLRVRPMPRLLLGLPSRQRTWIGMGCAAGVAAAFNAPLGGILYAFEEVCSHWSASLTWRSFFCVVIAAYTFNTFIRLYVDGSDGIAEGQPGDTAVVNQALITDSFIIGLDAEGSHSYGYSDFGWLVVIGIVGGIVGSLYTRAVIFGVSSRIRLLGGRPRLKVLDALLWSTIAFCTFYWAGAFSDCTACPPESSCYGGGTNATATDRMLQELPATSRGRRLAGAGGGLVFVQHWCEEGEYNELATLFLSPQEGLIKHLLQRTEVEVTPSALGILLALYTVIAVLVFGIAVPAGNFIPALTIGAAMGRLLGEVFPDDSDPGRFALMGAAAVLCGVTRMTITLAAILVEVTHDVGALLPLMFTLAVSKISADLLAPSFDDGMMHAQRLPFLEEEPPHELALLTARDVMSDKVIVLREVERVGDLLAVLRRCRHSGFPVVDTGRSNQCTFFSGLILRRHLLFLISSRAWEYEVLGLAVPINDKLAFVASGSGNAAGEDVPVSSLHISDEDRDQLLDLRPFMDPCPFLANELMPLHRVYRLFGGLGLRHLPVVDCREQVVGMITRKDVLPDIIEERVLAKSQARQRAERPGDRGGDSIDRGGARGASGRRRGDRSIGRGRFSRRCVLRTVHENRGTAMLDTTSFPDDSCGELYSGGEHGKPLQTSEPGGGLPTSPAFPEPATAC